MDTKNTAADLSKQRRSDRVDECVHPDYVSCRGCEHSYRPDLFDGGCKLYYERNAKKGGS